LRVRTPAADSLLAAGALVAQCGDVKHFESTKARYSPAAPAAA